MISNEIKSRIAQNCSLYFAKSYYTSNAFNSIEPSCGNCVNYVRGKCIKRVFDKIYDEIRIN